MKKSILFIMIVLLCCLFSCITLYQVTNKDYQVKGKRLVVISGIDNKANLVFAHHLTEAFKEKTEFRVISQKQVFRRIKGYPRKIKGPYTSAYLEIKENYSKTDIGTLKRYNRKLRADYMYVVWHDNKSGDYDIYFERGEIDN